MIVEAVRLLITLALAAAGFQIGDLLQAHFARVMTNAEAARPLGVLVGVSAGYVLGGILGRAIRHELATAPRVVAARVTGPQLFAGSFGVLVGLAVGVVVATPVVFFLPSLVGWPVAALLVLVVAAFAGRIFAARAHDFLAAAGLRPRGAMVRRPLDGEASRRFLLDTSACIDGRVLELVRAGLLGGELQVPAFVIDEMQAIADAGERGRRRRGRRGLDVLEALRDVPGVEVFVVEGTVPEHAEVDAKLIALADRAGATLITTDHNLAKAAGLRGLPVLNPHALGEALKKPIDVGSQMRILVSKKGTEPGQGVGYLDDGTMVVVEGGAGMLGKEVKVEVTGSIRNPMGRMVFSRLNR